jgi:hypothetical protein
LAGGAAVAKGVGWAGVFIYRQRRTAEALDCALPKRRDTREVGEIPAVVEYHEIVSKRRRGDEAVRRRTDGYALSPRQTIELSGLFIEAELHRVFHEPGRPQNASNLAVRAFLADALQYLLADGQTEHPIISIAHITQVGGVGA